jgi:hypothetical protein
MDKKLTNILIAFLVLTVLYHLFYGGIGLAPVDVSLTVGNSPPVIVSVTPLSLIPVQADLESPFDITVTATDPNGANDLLSGTATISITNGVVASPFQVTMNQISCSLAQVGTSESVEFTCNLGLPYYTPETILLTNEYIITATVTDSAGDSDSDLTQKLTVGVCNGCVSNTPLSPTLAFTGPIAAGASDVAMVSLGTPNGGLVFANEGNRQDIALEIESVDLTDSSGNSLSSNNFLVSLDSLSTACTDIAPTTLATGSPATPGTVSISNFNLPLADLFGGLPAPEEEIFFCLKSVPGTTAPGDYSTTNPNSQQWGANIV